MSIRRINIYGGPGSGKSTTSAGIYHTLGRNGFDVELVREFIKEEMVYRNIFPDGFDQVWIFGGQQHREEKALRRNGLIVTDCPLFTCVAYTRYYKAPCSEEMVSAANKFEAQYPSINLLLDREGIPYKDAGRYQKLEQAREVDAYIRSVLDENGVQYQVLRTVDFDSIVGYITGQLRASANGEAA